MKVTSVNDPDVNSPEQQPEQPRGCSGKLIILLFFGLAVVATPFAIWYRYDQQRRCIELWGSDVAMRIHKAKNVELLQLADRPGDAINPEAELLKIDDRWLAISHRKQVHKDNRAIKDIRKAILLDDYFDWEKSRGNCQGEWTHALSFEDEKGKSTVAFDFQCGFVRLTDTNKEASIAPMSDKIQPIFEKMFETAKKEDKAK